MPTTPPRCEDCRFFQPVPDSQIGLCRRWPPLRTWLFTGLDGSQYGGMGLGMAVVHWPPVAPHDWCGEFRSLASRRRH